MRVPISLDVIDLGPGMFASADWRVISRNGENYYLSCGEVIYEPPEGGSTSCIKPIHHATFSHEDFEGRLKDREFFEVVDLDYQVRELARKTLLRTGLDDSQVFNALNALQHSGVRLSREP